MNHKDHECLVWDNGLFVSLAETLGKDFGKVYYYSPYEGAFPRDAETAIGHGLPGVTRVFDPWKVIDAADKSSFLVMFPDTFYTGVAQHLRSLGYRVWAAGEAEWLETDRVKAKELFIRLGIPVPDHQILHGVVDLKEALKNEKDVYVKARYARIRATFETHHIKDYATAEPWLDEIEQKLGRRKLTTEFIIERSVKPAVEVSSELYMVDRQFPSLASVGVEMKGDGYLSRVMAYEDMPPQITEVNKILAAEPWGKDYAQFFTIETRVTPEGVPYPIDPCCRFGRPMIATVQANYANLSDIFWFGGEGVCIDPEPNFEWTAEAMIECETATTRGCVLDIPDEILPFVSISDCCVVKGKRVVVPADLGNIGSVAGGGSTMKEAIEVCKKRAQQITADAIEIHVECFDEGAKRLKELAEYGVVI